MKNVAAKVSRKDSVTQIIFYCPGCKTHHAPQVGKNDKPKWEWNGSLEKPTFKPSILCTWKHGEQQEERRCHSFVTDGKIRYLSDCTHELAGQTIELEPIDL